MSFLKILILISGKSTCTIMAAAKYEWYAEWKDKQVKKRGLDYTQTKNELALKIWQHVLKFFPQLEDKV